MRLLGGMLITKIQIAAMERIDTPEKLRKDFYLYVDEFQNFAVDSFASILSEARKYRLNLILAHQYIAQLSEPVRDAVFGNVGTIVSFRVGSPDALYLEPEFMPRFLAQDIIELPRAGVYIKLMIDGVTSQPFSASTLPPIAQKTGSTQKVIEQSRERYSGNRKLIEERVMAWSGFGDGVDIDVKMKEVSDAKKEAKKAKYSFAYTCTRCGKEFTLPIELDKSRPLYCEECKVIVDAERQKGKARSEVKKAGGPVQYAVPVKVGDGAIIPHPVAESIPLATLQHSPVSAPQQHMHSASEPSVMLGEGEKKKRKRKRKKKPGDQVGGSSAQSVHAQDRASAPVSLPRPSLPDDDSPIVL
jgi:DNA-directed RNA polymerase subunit RPC12/RpoP